MKLQNYKKTGLFFLLATVIPWGLWFLAGYISHLPSETAANANLASLISFAGLLAPIGITLVLAGQNPDLRKDLRGRIFNFRGIKPMYYGVAFLLMLGSILLAQAVSLLFGYSASQFAITGEYTFTSGVFPVWFMLIAAPLLEELAWHSYGTDSLRSRFNLFYTSVMFALYWGIWHFPLSSIKDYYHSNLVEEGWIYSLNFLLSLFPFVIIMNWLYYKTNRNMILPVVFHITAGFFNEIFATHPMSKVIQTGLLLLLSVYIVLKEWDFFFKKEYVIPDSSLQA